MNITIENPNVEGDLAFVLDQYTQLLEERGIECKVKRATANTKDGGIVLAVALSVVGWAASNMAWDLLKVSVNRLDHKLRNPTKFLVDGKEHDLSNLPEKLPSEQSNSDKH